MSAIALASSMAGGPPAKEPAAAVPVSDVR